MLQKGNGDPSPESFSAKPAYALDAHSTPGPVLPTKSDAWLPSLIVATPEDGFALAIKLSRVAVKKTQPSDDVRRRLRAVYEESADALIASSQVVAINFQTVAAANGYWRADSASLQGGPLTATR